MSTSPASAGLVEAWRFAVCCKIKGSEQHYIFSTGPCTIWRSGGRAGCLACKGKQESRDFTSPFIVITGDWIGPLWDWHARLASPKQHLTQRYHNFRICPNSTLEVKTLRWVFSLWKHEFFLSLRVPFNNCLLQTSQYHPSICWETQYKSWHSQHCHRLWYPERSHISAEAISLLLVTVSQGLSYSRHKHRRK